MGDKGFLLLSWIFTPFRADGNLGPLLNESITKKHYRSRFIVKNAFSLKKQSWHKLMTKIELDVKFVLDVVLACYILHNMVTGTEEVHIEELMCVLAMEAHNNMHMRNCGHHQYDETTRQ